MTDGILSRQDGAVLEITLNKPSDGNRVSDEMTVALVRLLDSAAETSSIVLLRAAGKDFCVGWGDLAKLPSPGSVEAYERRKQYDLVFECYSAFRRCKLPVMGVVQGPARGFGCAIASLCDITIASDGAIFQIPELAHNVLPTMVMSALNDRVPAKAVAYLVATAQEFSAERAFGYGIVSEVVPAAQLDDRVQTLRDTLLKAPLPALLGLKEYTRFAPHMEPLGAVQFARNLHSTINTSTEMKVR
jgi:enoyl-CoA hydratase